MWLRNRLGLYHRNLDTERQECIIDPGIHMVRGAASITKPNKKIIKFAKIENVNQPKFQKKLI